MVEQPKIDAWNNFVMRSEPRFLRRGQHEESCRNRQPIYGFGK